jgi:hypothetical protein
VWSLFAGALDMDPISLMSAEYVEDSFRELGFQASLVLTFHLLLVQDSL